MLFYAQKHKIPVNLFPYGQELDLIGNPQEITCFKGVQIAPKGIDGYVPLAEWIPAKYITKVKLKCDG